MIFKQTPKPRETPTRHWLSFQFSHEVKPFNNILANAVHVLSHALGEMTFSTACIKMQTCSERLNLQNNEKKKKKNCKWERVHGQLNLISKPRIKSEKKNQEKHKFISV